MVCEGVAGTLLRTLSVQQHHWPPNAAPPSIGNPTVVPRNAPHRSTAQCSAVPPTAHVYVLCVRPQVTSMQRSADRRTGQRSPHHRIAPQHGVQRTSCSVQRRTGAHCPAYKPRTHTMPHCHPPVAPPLQRTAAFPTAVSLAHRAPPQSPPPPSPRLQAC